MARRTKEDAQATHERILDAAEALFVEQGVSATTLQQIASAAGVTRGAVYWHFEDKPALFTAMMERAKMPLEAAMQALDAAAPRDPLGDLRAYALFVFRFVADDPKARRAFDIATLRTEYTEAMSPLRERRRMSQEKFVALAESRLRIGKELGQVRREAEACVAAIGLWLLIEGMIRNWLISPQYDLVELGTRIVDMHLDSLRAPAPPG